MNGGDSNNGQLLRDIEEISKALYLNKPSSKALVSTQSVRSKNPRKLYHDEMHKDKKSPSLWNWKKSLKAITNIRRHQFDICFFLHVHSIEGLPAYMNGFSFCVHWKRKDEVLSTHSVRVVDGVVEFEETLMHKCCVYGSGSGPHNSAKYDEKLFLIYPSVVGSPAHGIGEHLIDLTRLLPLTLEDLEGEKGSGKWTTSFKLTGKGKGAKLNVSFSFLVARESSSGNRNSSSSVHLTQEVSSATQHRGDFHANGLGMPQHLETVSNDVNHRSYLSPLSFDMKYGAEVLPHLGLELSKSITFLYQKLNEGNFHSSSGLHKLPECVEPLRTYSGPTKVTDEYETTDFFVIEQGVEMCQKDEAKLEQCASQSSDGSPIETINIDEILKDFDSDFAEEAENVSEAPSSSSCLEEAVLDDCRQEKSSEHTNSSTLQKLESAFRDMLISESSVSESPSVSDDFIENDTFVEVKSHFNDSKVTKKPVSLDDVAETVASDFLKMLEIEHVPFSLNSDSALESPRERLLREFENEALASGNFFLDFSAEDEAEEICFTSPGHGNINDDFSFSSVFLPSKEQKMESLSLKNRRKVKMIEKLETEDLMHEWGLDDKAFQSSPCVRTDGFGSPIPLSSDRVELPPLGDDFGHSIATKDGGVLRSLNPLLLANCKNLGQLVMQLSGSAVFPARMGTDIMEILQNLASLGIENLSLLLTTLMPLEDITGKSLQQVAAVVAERRDELQRESPTEQLACNQRKEVKGFQFCWRYDNISSGITDGEISPDSVPLENIVTLAMNRIETLALEGLRIQCGMSDDGEPSSVNSFSSGNMYFITRKDPNFNNLLSMERTAVSQFLDYRDDVEDINRLIGLCITLDEWKKLDAGIIGEGDHINDHTIEILAAHDAKCIDLFSGMLAEPNLDQASGIKHGLLGDNFTLAHMVLLRDSLRNYEPVGNPMIAFIEVERASVPYEQGISNKVPEGDQEQNLKAEEVEVKNECIPLFKITEVHLAGLITEPDNQHFWGTKSQQQSGSRWLLASGMAKSNKNALSKSKAIVRFYQPRMRKMLAKNVLWSLTSNEHQVGTSWKEMANLGPHSRNPDVNFPN